MAIELHHLHPSHDDELTRLKERIAELEALNHDLCERVTENDEIRLHWEEIVQTRDENERMKARIAELERMDTENTVQIAKMNGYISHLEEERRWRKFPDEKPEEDVKVLVYTGRPGFMSIQTDVYTKEDGFSSTREPRFRTYSPYVTHWMPQPSAPKEEK